jgi:uncharacterized ferritin-like protein (DUF455 family)
VEAKKRNQQTEAFVRQLLKYDKAGKLDLFNDILSAKEEKGAEEEEEEEVVDLNVGPSNARPANPSLVAPAAIEAPSTLESSGNSLEGSS